MRVMGLKLTPVLVRCHLGPLDLSGPIADASWTHSYPNERYNLPSAAHPPPPPAPLVHATCNIAVAVKKLLKIQQC